MTDILQAARSYYGLADTDVRKTDIYTNDANQVMLVFELALSAEDFIAIGARMKTLQKGDERLDEGIIEGPTVEAMREAYNALSKAERGKYKSFARYVAECSGGIVTEGPAFIVTPGYIEPSSRQVVHVDAPEEPEPVSMDAVWIHVSELNEAQRQFMSDFREDGCYLIRWDILTDEQKQKAKEAKP